MRQGEAIRQHPVKDVNAWCNHVHLFHTSDLKETTRRALKKRLSLLEMLKNCFYSGTEPIRDVMLTHIRQVLKEQQIRWPWCQGVVLVLDNLRMAHDRAAFSDTKRRILVAMSRILEDSFLISSTSLY